MTTTALKSSITAEHTGSPLTTRDHVDDRQNPSSLPVHIPASSLAGLRGYALRLAMSIRDWDRERTWKILRLMAPEAELDSLDRPFKKPDMRLLSFQFGFLAAAFDAADLHEVRNHLSEMLRAAHLA